jgi:hypothetical protein
MRRLNVLNPGPQLSFKVEVSAYDDGSLLESQDSYAYAYDEAVLRDAARSFYEYYGTVSTCETSDVLALPLYLP